MITRFQLMQPQVKSRFKKLRDAWDSRRERRAVAALFTSSPQTIHAAPRAERRRVNKAIQILGKRQQQVVRNWYEGGFPFLDGTRSWVPSIIQDARYDQNTVTRRELLRRMRYWAQNSGLCKSSLDVSRQYVIGTHTPVVTSMAKDSAWAERAEAVFEEMIRSAGIDGQSLLQLLTVAHDAKKVDGDVLFVETSRKRPITIRAGTAHETQITKSVPCYQVVEGHRLETPPNRWNDEGATVFDGVQFSIINQQLPDGRTRPTLVRSGYWVKDSISGVTTNQDAYAFINADNSFLVFSAHRVNQIRGLSDYYAGETTLALLEDLLKIEMRAQEVQSNIAVFITNGAGQIVNDKTQATLGALGIKVSKDGDGKPVVTSDDIEKAKEVYKKVWGGEVCVGRSGDTLELMAPSRPAEATLNLWEYLINLWCAAAKVPRMLVFPRSTKGQGTEIRAELDKANTAFIGEFNLNWKPLMHRIWNYFIGWAKDNDERLKGAPLDWQAIEVSPPRSVLVDHGYDSASMLAELAAGVTNLHFIAQRLGTTRKKLISAAVSDVYLLKVECARISKQPTDNIIVTAEEVRQSLSDVVKNLATAKQTELQKQQAELQNA
jgi:hypothetical protein